MAKQSGGLRITGTLGGLTFYESNGAYYVRSKTSLNKKRVMKDKAFEGSRARMKDFGLASQFCRSIYHSLPAKCKGQGIQQKMTGRAHGLFLEGRSQAEVKEILMKEFGES